MRIALAQTLPLAGNLLANLEDHLWFSERAASAGCSMIAFPELSLTGYEPGLAEGLATTGDDPRFGALQHLCDRVSLVIAFGVPLRTGAGIQIGMVILRPSRSPLTYAKQILHDDESPWFVPGSAEVYLDLDGFRVAPAICYESMQEQHVERARAGGVNVYLASVAKSATGLAKAKDVYPNMARQYDMHVLMVNSVGPCSEMVCGGGSEAWDRRGESMGRVVGAERTLLICDL